MAEKKKIKLSEMLEIAVMAASLPLQKKMGFKYDSKIKSLSEAVKAEIEYHIGDDLKSIREFVDKRVAEIRKPFSDQYNELSDDEKKEQEESFNAKIQSALMADSELTTLSEKESTLWGKPVVPEFEKIEVPDREYAELFGEPQEVKIFNRTHKLDPYQALLGLIVKDVISIIEQPSPTE